MPEGLYRDISLISLIFPSHLQSPPVSPVAHTSREMPPSPPPWLMLTSETRISMGSLISLPSHADISRIAYARVRWLMDPHLILRFFQ